MSSFISLLVFLTLLSLNSAQAQVPISTELELEFPLEELITPESFESSEEQPLLGYIPINLTQAENDPQIQGFLSIGVQNATQALIQEGSLPNGTYQISQVNSIEQNQDLTTVQDYRFNVEVSNGLGQNFPITFELFYHPDDRTTEVTSYSVIGQETGQESELEAETEGLFSSEEGIISGFVPLDLDQAANDPQIQGLLQIGLKNVTQEAIQDGVLPNRTYQAIKTYNIDQNLDAINLEEYLFDVEISAVDNNTDTSRLAFNITFDPITGISQVTSYSFLDDNGQPIETYTPLNLTAISMNPLIQGLMTVGIKKVTQQAIKNDSLPDGTYQVADVYSVGQGINDPNNYQFNVSVTNHQRTTADAFFTLSYDHTTELANITSSSITNVVTKKPTPPPPNNEPSPSPTGPSEIPKGFTAVDINSDQNAYQAGQNGFNYVIATAMLTGEVPYSYYTLTKINDVAKKNDGPRKTEYWFDVEAADGIGNSAELVYTVSYSPRTDTSNVLDYNVKNVVKAFS